MASWFSSPLAPETRTGIVRLSASTSTVPMSLWASAGAAIASASAKTWIVLCMVWALIAPFLFARGRRLTTLICCVTSEDILGQLKKVKYPGFSRDIVSFGLVKTAAFEDGVARVSLAISTNDPKVPKQLKDDVERALLSLAGVTKAVVELAVQAAKASTAAPGTPGAKPGAP